MLAPGTAAAQRQREHTDTDIHSSLSLFPLLSSGSDIRTADVLLFSRGSVCCSSRAAGSGTSESESRLAQRFDRAHKLHTSGRGKQAQQDISVRSQKERTSSLSLSLLHFHEESREDLCVLVYVQSILIMNFLRLLQRLFLSLP